MIKKLNKSQKSKKGAILVIVVLILALAMIFIASAMMLTQATRRRLYNRTMQSQARLTVTAASEVFLEALDTQEITDEMIDSVLGQTHGGTPIKMVVDGVPGMSEAENNCTKLDIYSHPEDADYVICDFTTTIGEEIENVRVYLHVHEDDPNYGSRFTNQIEVDANLGVAELRFSQGVGMWNKTTVKKAPTDNTIVMKSGLYTKTADSCVFSDVIFGKNSKVLLGGGDYYYGKMIFLENSKLSCRSNCGVYGDIYIVGKNNGAGCEIVNVDGGKQQGMWDTIKNNPTSQKIVFAGRTAQAADEDDESKIKTALNNKTCYFLDSKGACITEAIMEDGKEVGRKQVDGKGTNKTETNYTVTNYAKDTKDGVSSTIKKNVTSYLTKTYAKDDSLPDADTVFKGLCPDGHVETVKSDNFTLDYDTYTPDGKSLPAAKVIPKGTKYVKNPVTTSYPSYKKVDGKPEKTLNLDKDSMDKMFGKLSNGATNGGYVDLPAGYYLITTSDKKIDTAANANCKDNMIFCLDGSKEYRFYFEGNKQYILNRVVFAMYNVSDDTKPVLFILEDGAEVQLSDADFGDTSKLCKAGFLSMNRGKTSASAIASHINKTSYSAECYSMDEKPYSSWAHDYDIKDKDGKVTKSITFNRLYDGVHIPKIFVYGAGNNKLILSKSTVIEAYVGLYGSSEFGVVDGCSDIMPIYGRIEVGAVHGYGNKTFKIGKEVPCGEFQMPYCPQPNADDGSNKIRPAKSKYDVVDITYYYGTLTPKTVS